jgi:hypothetical protein
MLNPDFSDMLSALSAENAEFLVVGGYALSAHGYPRATGDIDIWIRATEENAARVYAALKRFKAPLSRLTEADLTEPDVVFQIGVAPNRIDILTSIDAVDFDEAWADRKTVELGGQTVAVMGREHLIKNKKAIGRPRDLADVAELERLGWDG